MTDTPQWPRFIGKGAVHDQPWQRSESAPPEDDPLAYNHPRFYIADDGLVAAVNTALLLDKPLLVTGNPGTGKSDLAERLAWEFGLGPVLRFEAQSLSEAGDLFYRFDLVGRLAESRLQADQRRPDAAECLVKKTPDNDKTHPVHFIEFGPFGKAILRAGQDQADPDPARQALLERLRRQAGVSGAAKTRRAVVLIDEIDKASRDFPNDLLNGLERMEFRIRELDNLLVGTPDKAQGRHPIVIITSNLERDLPPPFLRRCAFYHIPDPGEERLAEIVRARVFPGSKGPLPPFYRELTGFFFDYKNTARHVYTPGTTEIIEASLAMAKTGVAGDARLADHIDQVCNAASVIAKHGDDLQNLAQALELRRRPA